MNRSARRKTLLCFLMITLSYLSADAAEIQLKPHCRCHSTLVRLGDIATIEKTDQQTAERLAAIELFPAPLTSRSVRMQLVQERLVLHGVDLSRHRLSGASRVQFDVEHSETAAIRAVPLSQQRAKQAAERLRQAIVRHLQTHADSRYAWQVILQVNESALRHVAGATRPLTIAGGRQPWVGPQSFIVTIATPRGPLRLTVHANIELPRQVVVAVRPLRRGDIIRREHVAMRPADAALAQGEFFHRIDDVVGMEVFASISPDQALSRQKVRQQLLVRRGDVVAVYSRAAGIQIRTTAVAREDGARGENIMVQTTDRKNTYQVRVSNYQEVVAVGFGRTADQR